MIRPFSAKKSSDNCLRSLSLGQCWQEDTVWRGEILSLVGEKFKYKSYKICGGNTIHQELNSAFSSLSVVAGDNEQLCFTNSLPVQGNDSILQFWTIRVHSQNTKNSALNETKHCYRPTTYRRAWFGILNCFMAWKFRLQNICKTAHISSLASLHWKIQKANGFIKLDKCNSEKPVLGHIFVYILKAYC